MYIDGGVLFEKYKKEIKSNLDKTENIFFTFHCSENIVNNFCNNKNRYVRRFKLSSISLNSIRSGVIKKIYLIDGKPKKFQIEFPYNYKRNIICVCSFEHNNKLKVITAWSVFNELYKK